MPTAIKSIDEIKAELEAVRAKKVTPERQKRDWYGLVYCASNGWASIVGGDFKGIWLGKTDEVIPYLRSRGIKGENVDIVLQAVKEFWSERKSQSCHLAMGNDTPSMFTPKTKPHRATLLSNPQFAKLLGELISKGYGIPTIQKELRGKGYDISYRTLGRWVKKMKETRRQKSSEMPRNNVITMKLKGEKSGTGNQSRKKRQPKVSRVSYIKGG